MDKSLPARPSLEQLKKLAKDLVKAHEEKQPAALELIRTRLPAAAGKTAEEIARSPFALHDAQSVIARAAWFSELECAAGGGGGAGGDGLGTGGAGGGAERAEDGAAGAWLQ